MKKSIAEKLGIGIVVPALILSLAACGASNTQDASAKDAAGAEEAAAETAAETTENAGEEKAADTAAAQTADPMVYEFMGYKLTVPGELADKITVESPAEDANDDRVIFKAFETKSVEAAKAKGEENMSLGLLFGLTIRDEKDTRLILAEGVGGQDPIAKTEDGEYIIYNHPTDVRYERATPEEMEKDQDEWTAACEWANYVCENFAKDNGLTPVHYNETQVEAALARAAFIEDTNYTISTLEHGPLEPNGADPIPFYEKMTTGAKYEAIEMPNNEGPDGEYVVLNFPDEGNRYDFFLAEGGENIIRLVNSTDGQEYEYYYQVTFEDGSKKASEIMHEWYNALVEANGIQ